MSDPLYDPKDMEGKTPIEQAYRAILYTLQRCAEDPALGYYINLGTTTFNLLTEAFATLSEDEVRLVRIRFANRNAKNPKSEETVAAESIEHETVDVMVESDVTDYLDETDPFTRMMLLQRLRDRYCFRCGGIRGISFGPCGCIQASRALRRAAA